jgi:hypothetical protein
LPKLIRKEIKFLIFTYIKFFLYDRKKEEGRKSREEGRKERGEERSKEEIA